MGDQRSTFKNRDVVVNLKNQLKMYIFNYIAEFYKQVTALKSKGKKVLLALGGWNDSAGDKLSLIHI